MLCGLVALAEPSRQPLPPQHPFHMRDPSEDTWSQFPTPSSQQKNEASEASLCKCAVTGLFSFPSRRKEGRSGGLAGWSRDAWSEMKGSEAMRRASPRRAGGCMVLDRNGQSGNRAAGSWLVL